MLAAAGSIKHHGAGMKIRSLSKFGVKQFRYSVFAGALACTCLVNAEPMEPGELRSMVWEAAQEIENGNVDTARDMLNKAAAADNQPADVSSLISRLQSSLNELDSSSRNEGSAEESARVSGAESQTEQSPQQIGMSEQEMETYIDSLSDAVDSLFEKGT